MYKRKLGTAGKMLVPALFGGLLLLTGCSAEAWMADHSLMASSSVASEEVVSESEEVMSSELAMALPERNPDDWNLVLVNKDRPLSADYVPTTLVVEDGAGAARVDERIQPNFDAMVAAMAEAGCHIQTTSGYRPRSWQQSLYDQEVQEQMALGLTEAEAKIAAAKEVAVPGTSEHQTGLAVDVALAGTNDLVESFGNTPEGKWLQQHAHEYGFVIRYPKDKEEITGIIYEPWHLRYVGVDHATAMWENSLCLEEYLADVLPPVDKTQTASKS